jgi:hypothetical protein
MTFRRTGTECWRHNDLASSTMVPIPPMLSFTFRRVLSHPGIFSIAQRLPTRVISSNQSLATTVQRNLTITASDRNSDSGVDSESKPKSKPKSTGRKTGTTPKLVGTVGKGEGKQKPVREPKGMRRSF